MKGLLEARQELRPVLSKSSNRLKDLLFLDIALDSTVRTAIERGYEELNNAGPEVNPWSEPISIMLIVNPSIFLLCFYFFINVDQYCLICEI